jgi:tryptophan synthase
MAFVPLVTPTTSDERLRFIDSVADSFIYCVSLLGVTGTRTEISPELPAFIDRVRRNVRKPIAIGFGVSTRFSVIPYQISNYREIKDTLAKYGEGVVVGSAFIKTIEATGRGEAAQAILEKTRYFTNDTQLVEVVPSTASPTEEQGI